MTLDRDALSERLRPIFASNFEERGELGAAISIWQAGEPILELSGGFRESQRQHPWESDTIVLVWSATKGLGSACLLHLLQEQKISLERRIAEFWPEFAQQGKGEISLAEIMSHGAGLCALEQAAQITDYPSVIAALEQQRPLWRPGSAHGYHARTFGFLLDEIMRRIGGVSLSQYWRKTFAEPLALDFWIGLPLELNRRCATIYAAKAGSAPAPAAFYHDLARPGTLQRRTFTSPAGLSAVSAMNKPENRALELVSLGGIGSAHALAKFYALLANDGEISGRRYFKSQTLAQMTTVLTQGKDLVFEIPTAFSAGFMKAAPSETRNLFGPSASAFGHPGAGGSHAFADPENKIAFAYVMNQMEQSLLPNEKSLGLVNALYA